MRNELLGLQALESAQEDAEDLGMSSFRRHQNEIIRKDQIKQLQLLVQTVPMLKQNK